MEYCIHNKFLKVRISTCSAEIQSICSKNGTEYLWQGDPSYWAGRAPTLFPYVGRLTEQAYTYENQRYSMGIHGFTLDAEFRLEFLDENRLRLALSDSPETLKQYPFRFCLTVEYYLQGNRLGVCYQVENRDEKSMYFGLGGHPGFRVPLEAGKKFEDYYLEFSEPCQPNRVKFTKECFITGEEPPYPLEQQQFLRLHHDLFNEDALVLKNTAKQVKLCCPGGKHSVTMFFPDFPILGLWHTPFTSAPYICLEPWSSLPAKHGEITCLQQQRDLISLKSGELYKAFWSVELN